MAVDEKERTHSRHLGARHRDSVKVGDLLRAIDGYGAKDNAASHGHQAQSVGMVIQARK